MDSVTSIRVNNIEAPIQFFR